MLVRSKRGVKRVFKEHVRMRELGVRARVNTYGGTNLLCRLMHSTLSSISCGSDANAVDNNVFGAYIFVVRSVLFLFYFLFMCKQLNKCNNGMLIDVLRFFVYVLPICIFLAI